MKQSLEAQRRHLQGDVRVQGKGPGHAHTCPVLRPESAPAGTRLWDASPTSCKHAPLKHISSCTLRPGDHHFTLSLCIGHDRH